MRLRLPLSFLLPHDPSDTRLLRKSNYHYDHPKSSRFQPTDPRKTRISQAFVNSSPILTLATSKQPASCELFGFDLQLLGYRRQSYERAIRTRDDRAVVP